MPPPKGTTGSELSRGRWAFAFALVTSLFFTWGFAYGLLDVLNAHFQQIFGINKTQSTLLQLAYFGAYMVFAPVAGIFMKRYGYKRGVHLGLSLYSLGAIFFWPSAKFAKYGGFVGCTFVIGCGLATLEVAANSYIAVLGSPKYAAARLNFSQGFQGLASFAGPLIASKYFFQGANATRLDTVQWVYLAVAGLGLVLNTLFYFCDLPEITEEALATEVHEAGIHNDEESFWKQYRCIFGFVAQTTYVGAQVGVASLAVNFMSEQGVGIDKSRASQLFSFCQLTFTFARFVGVAILNFVDPALLLTLYGVMCSLFSLLVAVVPGRPGIGFLFCLFWFESICYPGVGGGAWYPPAQAALADRTYTRHSYLVPLSGYLAMSIYAAGIVIDQTVKGGFRFRNIDELAHKKEKNAEEAAERRGDSIEKDKSSGEFVETT
ncbi:Glucose/galactose transporter [Leucoagaricus sp. SymC.cos]|nr:Glucose/galactose transporter [Leucoagaricus sp. SymC.cos]